MSPSPDGSMQRGPVHDGRLQEVDELLGGAAAVTALPDGARSRVLGAGAALAAREGLEQFSQTDIEFHRINVEQTVALAMQYGLSAYDAAYLWLAADLKCPLATFDDKLAAAAKVHLAGLP